MNSSKMKARAHCNAVVVTITPLEIAYSCDALVVTISTIACSRQYIMHQVPLTPFVSPPYVKLSNIISKPLSFGLYAKRH